jgi:hypothetical protein
MWGGTPRDRHSGRAGHKEAPRVVETPEAHSQRGTHTVNTPDAVKSTTLEQLQALVANTAKHTPELEGRAQRGALIVLMGKVAELGDDRYEVVGTDDGKLYLVDQAAESCTCPDFQHRAPVVRGSKLCKHRLACLFLVELGRSPRPSARVARLATFRPACVRRAQRLIGRAA